jgi:hypothetical protein
MQYAIYLLKTSLKQEKSLLKSHEKALKGNNTPSLDKALKISVNLANKRIPQIEKVLRLIQTHQNTMKKKCQCKKDTEAYYDIDADVFRCNHCDKEYS